MERSSGSIPAPSQRARRASGDGAGRQDGKPRRFSARRKEEVVLRLMRGEDLELLSREWGVPAARISGWREAFLAAGKAALKRRSSDMRDEEVMRLRAKLGEITMKNELLEEKIDRLEGGRPLRRRRSRR